MTFLCDTHCHLDFTSFQDDLEAVLERASEAGVRRLLIPGVDIQSSQRAVELAIDYQEVFAAVGVHPNYADSWNETTISTLEILAQEPKVVAIGEIGLDYYRMRVEKDQQQIVFRNQLEIAGKLGLPVVVHNRNATSSILDMLTEWHSDLVEFGSDLAERAGVLHSYSDGLWTAKKAEEINLSIGITGPVTFKKSFQLREAVAGIPLEQLLIETDSPYLAPEPYRGRRNEPANVRYVAEKLAELHETTLAEISEKTTENANRLFLW